MAQKKNQKSGGAKKYGRNKKPVDQPTSNYVKGSIPFESYQAQKGFKNAK